MKKIIIISSVIFFGIGIIALAGLEDIQFPLAELGNCANEQECQAYCDKDENMASCLNFAEKYQLLSQEEIEMGRKMLQIGQRRGPGGCLSKKQCEAYCDKAENMKECIEFAKKNNLIPPEELAEAEKVLAAIERGATPPPCKGKKDCDKYCSRSAETMKKCITFGKEAGLIPENELPDVDRMLQALERGVEPLPCAGKEACDKYCEDENNFPKCLEFAKAAGFISDQDYEMARKTGGKGPGGCKSKEQCESFCQKPENQKTCLEFAKEKGLIPEAELKEMEEGQQRMKDALNLAPPEVVECLKTNFGQDVVEKIQAGNFMPPRERADQVRQCFEQFMPRGPEGGPPGLEKPGPEGGFREGPGGCNSPDECQRVCQENPELCRDFGAPGEEQQPISPGFPPEFEGKCTNAQECMKYCIQNPSDSACQKMAAPLQGTMPQPPRNFTPPEGFQPPAGGFQLPEGVIPPPESAVPPTVPPPSSETQPSTKTSPPSSFKAMENFLASLITIFAPR